MNIHSQTQQAALYDHLGPRPVAPSIERPHAAEVAPEQEAPGSLDSPGKADDDELREAFESFVGQTFFGQMFKAMRKSLDKPAYFHGGRAEEIFQQQLDQVLAEKMSDASADKLAGPMFELFTMRRQ